ncbi:pectin lyase fold/virulence factor [Aspergillus californicus]
MNGTDMKFNNIRVTVMIPPLQMGYNGCQQHRTHNFTFTGGDDCVAIKPRSYNVHISNITCTGGNGIAIGSLGQYLKDSSVENVTINNAKPYRAYIKTWMGHLVPQPNYESGGLPRGGGWGVVRNITFSNFDVTRTQRGMLITQSNGNNGSFKGTSKMEISDITFADYTGVSGMDFVSNDGDQAKGVCTGTTDKTVVGLRGVDFTPQ